MTPHEDPWGQDASPLAARPRRRWLPWAIGAAVLVALFVFRAQIAALLPGPVSAWFGAPVKALRPAAPPRLVGVARVEERNMPVQVSAVGVIEPLRTVAVKTRIDGQVVAVRFKAGDSVKAGAILFQLDDRPARAALEQAQAALARDAATLETQEQELARQEKMLAEQIVAQRDLDLARTAVEVTRQTLAVDRAALDNAKLTLEYTTIRAPINGRTGKVLIDIGNMARAADPGPLVTINEVQPIYASFSVPQRYLDEVRSRAKAGPPVVTVSNSDSTRPIAQGVLDFVDNSVDPATGTILLRAVFKNDAEALWPGQFVAATLVLREDRRALVVPPDAIQTGRNETYAYVVKPDNTVAYRPVTVDRIVDGAAVISAGLQAGETVVTDGQLNLLDGSRIQAAAAPSKPGKP
jgi:multidrug efflux system membrane fusion protein